MSKRASEMLAEKVQSGLTLEVARDSTILEIGLEVGLRLAQQPLRDVLASLGLEESLAPKIIALASTKGRPYLAESFMVGVSGGGAAGIPPTALPPPHLRH